MNKTEFASKVAKRNGMTNADAQFAVETVFNNLSEALAAGEEVRIPSFGIFQVVTREGRTCRNPKTGETVQTSTHGAPVFKPSKALKEAVRDLKG